MKCSYCEKEATHMIMHGMHSCDDCFEKVIR